MGFPKLSAQLGEHSGSISKLGGYGLKSALKSRIRPILAVTKPGPVPDWLQGCLRDDAEYSLIRVTADEAEQGMAYSIRAGITEALVYDPKAVIVLLADQPLVTTDMIERLVARWETEPELDYTAYWKDDAPTPPILLAASMFPSLLALSGDQGARKLLKDPGYKGVFLLPEWERSLTDVDTEQDLDLLVQEMKLFTTREMEG